MMKRLALFCCLCFLNLVFVASCDQEDQDPQRILVNVTDNRCQTAGFDKDGDGFLDAKLYIGSGCLALRTGPFDCNDNDASVFPGADETCNGVDDDCDNAVDEGLSGCTCNLRLGCDDELFCNGQETCVATSSIASVCSRTASPCVATSTTPRCDETANRCVACLDGTHCADGIFCNGDERCISGVCGTGTPPCGLGTTCVETTIMCVSCDDGNACTDDTVNTTTGACTNAPRVGCCLTDASCGQSERCDAMSRTCVAVACADDGDRCTVETVVNRICTRPIPAGCCRGPMDDAACTASRPATLPVEYRWGCSNSGTSTTTPTGYVCTSCRDDDGDGFCGGELCANGRDDNGDGRVDETPCTTPAPTDAGVPTDSGVMGDSGVSLDAGMAMDSGVPQCTTDVQCGAGRFCAGGTCAPFVDQRGRTPYGASGLASGADGTPDARDDDGDGFCEIAPCTGGSRNPSFASMSLLGGDCDDDPGDSTPFTVTTAAGSFQTDGSFANHPGGTDFCESPAPGFDNDCDGTPNDGCP